MTGYANAASEAGETAAAAVTVEARSVNGRFLDLALRLPDELRGLEPALRELLTATFRRGKIELRVSTSREAESGLPAPTSDQLNRLAYQQSSVQGWLPQARSLTVNEVLHWCKGGSTAQKLDEPALDAARRCVDGSSPGPGAVCRSPSGQPTCVSSRSRSWSAITSTIRSPGRRP